MNLRPRGTIMKGTRKGMGAEDNGGIPLNGTGSGHDREHPNLMALPPETLRCLRQSCKVLGNGRHKILNPRCCSVTARADATQYLALAWSIARCFQSSALSRG